MGRYFGKVGYAVSTNKGYGVWKDSIVEREYYGDIYKLSSKWQNAQGLNDDLVINNQISIVADPFALENFAHIKYAEILGTRWKVTSVEPQYPRILLNIGGVYNGEIPEDNGG